MSGNDRNRNRKINSKKLGIPDKEHYLNKGGVGTQNGHQALYISFHQPTRGRIYDFYEQAPLQLQSKCTLLFVV